MYFRSNLVQNTSTGANIAPVIRPSHQFRWMSSTVTPKNITMLVIRKTIPNPANRRMDDRSVVARDSSWPDCHSSWNAGSSRSRCAYRSSLIVFSMSATALPCTQRRIRLSMADATPRAIAAMPNGISRSRSWCAMAPSITTLTSSGIATSAPSAARAATIIAISWKRYGRRYGRSRQRAATGREDTRRSVITAAGDVTWFFRRAYMIVRHGYDLRRRPRPG